MLREGDKILTLQFAEASLTTPLPACRFLVAAAVAAGLKLMGEQPWLDYITGPGTLEEFATSTDKRRVIRVSFDARVKASLAGETFDARQFRERYEDVAWLKEHNEHPIAYLRAGMERLLGLGNDLKTMKPLLHLHRADRDVYIPQDAPPEKVHQLMWWFNHGVRSTPPPLPQPS